ncbi:MAG: HIT domain-containing protein [Halobacteriales archaeon]|nr:HIT domain-containing protein [Halobacteriales archaeon]
MEQVFAPWRIKWVRREKEYDECVFCRMRDTDDDREERVVARSERAFVVLNNSPYNPGHVMVVPHEHTGEYTELDDDTLLDHARLKRATFNALRASFDPDGFNTGLNLGEGAGGSIDDHLHTHVVPRWKEDTNFMPVTSDTKVIVQALEDSYDELREGFASLESTEEEGDGAVRLR